MIDKVKTILTITLIVIVVFAVGYSIVKLIISAFEKPNLITLSNLEDYKVEENLITGYATYYYYEACLKNCIESCEKELYSELYDIYIHDYTKEYSKEEIINTLKNIKDKLTPKHMDESITYKLDKLYSVDHAYLAEITINEHVVYMVFNESNSKDINYNFAVVK